MKRWLVKVERVVSTVFEMTEDMLEGESPEVAAEELACSIPSNEWYEEDSFLEVNEL